MNAPLELATFAGGCFWCTEAVFKRLIGVVKVTSGYTGGEIKNPSYAQVSTGETNHAEAIQIQFDPKVIPFERLLEIFWATHDPTTLNRQGADVGTQYRSEIFYHNQGQKQLALKSKKQMEKSGALKDTIVTKIEPIKKFYKAEDYHQNYYDTRKNQNSYCSIVIDPKIQKLLDKFGKDVKDEYKN